MILVTLDNATQGELQIYENNYKAFNLITTALVWNVYDHVAHLETAHDVWLKLCNTYEASSEIKSLRRDTYNKQYQTFSHNPGESLDDCFARFEFIVSSLHSCGPLAHLKAIKILLAFAASKEFKLYQLDMKSDFLNCVIQEEVYVRQPPGFKNSKYPDRVYKLSMALYGLKQAPRAWYARLKSFLLEHGYVIGCVDKTLFTLNRDTDFFTFSDLRG
jgi:hypothetical protein